MRALGDRGLIEIKSAVQGPFALPTTEDHRLSGGGHGGHDASVGPADAANRRPPIRSAALLVCRLVQGAPEFLLAHPGGPFWRARDDGAWSIPKGLIEPGETEEAAARREFEEETGLSIEAALRPLTPCKAYRGKTIVPFLAIADLDLSGFRSQTFPLVWPPRSGRTVEVPEVDRVAYFPATAAAAKILPAQAPILREAEGLIRSASP